MAIARGFIEAMGGSIALEDTPGGGLMVSITLPAAPGTVGDELTGTAPITEGVA